jgi:GTP cyclohydrolase I
LESQLTVKKNVNIIKYIVVGMGNKIIKITNDTTNKPSNDELVVYKDISMNSTRKITSSFDETENDVIYLKDKQ